MKLGQFKRKVIKEFAKSPAKTVILIALCPVALYFVVPLFFRARPKIDEAQRAKVIAPKSDLSTTQLTSHSSVPAVRPGPTWQQLIGWMDADWRRKPGVIAVDQRNPFQPPAVKVEDTVAVVAAPDEEPEAAFSQEAFAAMGLKLTGTLVGSHSRSAMINGKRYLEGTMVTPVPSGRPGTAGDHAFVLKHVGPRNAVLELDGRRFQLVLDAPQSPSSSLTVVRGQTGASN